MRKETLAKVAVLTVGILLLATTASEAQRRKQPGGRQRGRQAGGRFNRNPLAILENETLQKELGLTAAQKKRVKELSLQMQGTAAITTDAVAQELGVSDSQKTKIQEARTAVRQKLFQRPGNGGRQRGNFNLQDFQKRLAEYRAASDKATLAVLTSSQQSKWKKMLGKPADVSKLRPQFRGFGGRNRQGNRKIRPKTDI